MTDPTNIESPDFTRPHSPPANPYWTGSAVGAFIGVVVGLIMAVSGATAAAKSLNDATRYTPADTSGLIVSSLGTLLLGVSVAAALGLLFYSMAQWDRANRK